MDWYLVHTKPKQEIRAKKNLEQQGYVCYLPILHSEKLQKENFSIVPVPLFPRYLFIQLGHNTNDKGWSPIRSTKGVNRLVVFGTAPAKVDEHLIAALQKQERHSQAHPEKLYSAGERVQLIEGAFSGLEGVYQMTDGEGRAMILIELLSRPVSIQLNTTKLRKIS